jgi:hypothetical protein
MRNFLVPAAIFLTACGSAITTADNAAGASQGSRRGNQTRPAEDPAIREAREMEAAIEGGGMPGCFDPSLRGRERAVAERLGGTPCASAGGASPPREVSARGATWIVGWWIEREEFCGEGGMTYRADGTFTHDSGSGRWRLNGNTLIETQLRTSDGNMEEASNEPVENPQPVRSQILSVAASRNAFTVRYPDGRVWNMKRCG